MQEQQAERGKLMFSENEVADVYYRIGWEFVPDGSGVAMRRGRVWHAVGHPNLHPIALQHPNGPYTLVAQDGREFKVWFENLQGSIKAQSLTPDHIYLAVTCNTPGCKTACILKYLGLYTGQSQVDDLVPEKFQFQCGDCGKSHWYKRTEVYPVITEKSPPSGLTNSF